MVPNRRERGDTGGGGGQAKGSASRSRAERRRLEREGGRPSRRRAESKGSGHAAPREAGRTSLGFTLRNAVFGGAGLLAVILGFVLLSQGSITLAPMLLLVGYGVLIPMALFL